MSQSYHEIIAAVKAAYPNWSDVYVTSTVGGGHAPGSWHYSGNAVDFGAATQARKDALAEWLYPMSSHFRELIHTRANGTTGWYAKNGKKVSNSFYSSVLKRAHINHNHLAMTLLDVSAMLRDPYYLSFLHPNPTPLLRTGAVGSPVVKLQASLNTAGAIPALVPDGSFGPATEHAVKVFQSTHGLIPDGVVGPLTWRALGV